MSTAAQFDGDADSCSRFLSDVTQSLAERDQLKRTNQPAADAGGRVRSSLSKAEKALEKITASLKNSEMAGTAMCVIYNPHKLVQFHKASTHSYPSSTPKTEALKNCSVGAILCDEMQQN
jgi:hypothetical protein